MLVITAFSVAAATSALGKLQWLLGGVLQPLPMIGLGYAIRQRRRWARIAAVALPAVIYLLPRLLGLQPFLDYEGFFSGLAHQVAGLLQLHLPFAVVLACVVVWQLAGENVEPQRFTFGQRKEAERSTQELAPPAEESAASSEATSIANRWRTVSRLYAILGGIVGVPLLLLLMVATQAARSAGEMFGAMLLSVLQLAPMAGLALGLKTGKPWVKALAVAYPFAIAMGQLAIRGRPQPRRGDQFGATYAVVYNLITSQRYYLVFAAALGLAVIGLTLVERKARPS